MKIAVLNEFSSADKNCIVVSALAQLGHDVINIGMRNAQDMPFTTYVDLGFLAAVLLNSGAVDFIVTGCSTGEGAMIALNHYPNVFCGLLLDPVDAHIFSQLNCGNAISLSLNKGYGVGGDQHLQYILGALFASEWGNGFPAKRKEFQAELREQLAAMSVIASRDMQTIIQTMPAERLVCATDNERFMSCLHRFAGDSPVTQVLNDRTESLAE